MLRYGTNLTDQVLLLAKQPKIGPNSVIRVLYRYCGILSYTVTKRPIAIVKTLCVKELLWLVFYRRGMAADLLSRAV